MRPPADNRWLDKPGNFPPHPLNAAVSPPRTHVPNGCATSPLHGHTAGRRLRHYIHEHVGLYTRGSGGTTGSYAC